MKRNWILTGAVAAMLASASAASFAQDATPPPAVPAPAPDMAPTPAPMPDMATPPAPPMPDASMTNPGTLSTGTMMTPPGAIDYSVLGNPDFNYTDLKKAKADGFSDNTVASIAKLSHYSGVPFNDVVDRVLHGTTLSALSTQYGAKLGDVLDVADEKDKIAAYETAYEATGEMAVKSSMMASTMPMSGSMAPPMAPMAPKDIVATAMSEKKFSTLVKELKKADLVSALEGPGPFTVFAPTNDAFKKLPKGALKELEKDPTKLAAVLKYHVLPARVDAATASSMTSPTSPPTLEGSTLQVTASGGTVKINDATVTQADIIASNGIIHAIDTVLMPSDMTSTSTPMGTTAPPVDTAPSMTTPSPTPDAATPAPDATTPAPTPDAATPAPVPAPATP